MAVRSVPLDRIDALMPPPSRKKPAGKNIVRFRVEAVEYTVDRDEITPRIERELFTQAGVTPTQAMQAVTSGAVFGVAALMFIARRQAGEQVVYQNIEDRLWAAMKDSPDDFDLTILGDDEEVVTGPPA